MPRIVVKTNPDGSLLPGIMNFAATPARNPTMMVQIILILQLPLRGDHASRGRRQNILTNRLLELRRRYFLELVPFSLSRSSVSDYAMKLRHGSRPATS